MIGKEKIKFVRSLHQKKFRQKYNKFIAEGPKIVSECLSFCKDEIETIYGLPVYLQTLDSQDNTLNEKLIPIDDSELRKISALDTPNQVLAVINKNESNSVDLEGDALFLDGIQIPNNVGAILRIADWFKIKTIIFSPTTADRYSPKVIQASMGSFLRLHSMVVEPHALKSTFPSHQLVVADGNGDSLKDMDFQSPNIVVLGSEGSGPSQVALDQADKIVSIDRVGGDYPESLNVGIAAGILCHAWKG